MKHFKCIERRWGGPHNKNLCYGRGGKPPPAFEFVLRSRSEAVALSLRSRASQKPLLIEQLPRALKGAGLEVVLPSLPFFFFFFFLVGPALPKEDRCPAWCEEPVFWSLSWALSSAVYQPCELQQGSSLSHL